MPPRPLTLCWLALSLAIPSLAQSKRTILLATTTSTQDTGLLDELVPAFEKKTGYTVKTIAVGSGQAMTMGQKGEADVLLVHSPDAEKAFVAGGFGVNRRLVMHNDFVLVGPPADPAKVKAAKTVAEALKAIQARGAIFASRGDKSGTHATELKLWKAAGITPEGQGWYQSTGQGMGQTLGIASEKRGYTLTDRGTYLSLKKRLDLVILKEGEASLLNVYHVIEVNAAKFPKVNAPGARAFSDFMVDPGTQKVIATFGTAKFGGALFFPDAGKPDTL